MICSLEDPAARDVLTAGGKAATLARLIAAKFAVPEGFVLTSAAEPELASYLDNFLKRIGPQSRVAVRSSGYSEDSAESSFAGQYETVLGVHGKDEIAAAIKRCFASFSNARSAAYREARNAGRSGGAVVVQKLIESEAAGIAFTIDPISGSLERVCIEANFGLGDSVAAGQVTPDAFAVHKTTAEIVERRIAKKNVRSVLAGNTSHIEAMPQQVAVMPSLPDDAVRAVALLACAVEAHQGMPVDIEWAWKDGGVWLLQARPVTVPARSAPGFGPPPQDWTPELNTAIDARFPLYSSGNVGEALPGCVTPLTYSICSQTLEHAFRDVTEYLGSMPKLGPEPIVVGFFFHRLYLNVSYFLTAADNSPGSSRDTVYEELIGPPPGRHPAWRWETILPWNLLRGLRIFGRYLALQGSLDKDIAECHSYYERRKKLLERSETEWSNAELADWLAPKDDEVLKPVRIHIRASQFANHSFRTLRNLTKRWLKDGDGALASMLVTGIGSIAGANPAYSVFDMSRLVLADPALRALFAEEPDNKRLLSRIGSPLREAFDDFIVRFGHRGFREAEFRNPCWREQPWLVLALVREQLDPGVTAPARIAVRQAEISASARTQALAGLSGLRRRFFVAVLEAARKHIAAREEMKDLLLQLLYLTRCVIGMSQQRLRDVLEPDDIYFLLAGEIALALKGELAASEIGAIIQRRRRDFEWSSRVEVPKIQDGVARRLDRPEAAASPKRELTGIPVSPGRVEGPARVVFDPTRESVASGEILVAAFTDVAWTPMFLRAAGVIVEVGGLLSHGSIVAREYGIPAVTGVADATSRIRNGAWIELDGSQGIVRILRET